MNDEPTREEILRDLKASFVKHPEFALYIQNPKRATNFKVKKPRKGKVKNDIRRKIN